MAIPTSTTTAAKTRHRRYGTLEEAAEWFGCSPRTIRRMVAAGELTGYRLGKRLVRIDLDELDGQVSVIPTTSAS